MKPGQYHKTFFIITVIAIAIIKLKFHELWKDEWQAYLVARDMPLLSMLNFLNYEGHPSLWYLYLKCWSLFSAFINEELLISASHFFLVIIVLYLIYFKMTIPLLIKIAFSFSYFSFYEYGVVNRGYILVILFTLITILCIKENKKNLLPIYLAILCQTEVSGVIIALSLGFYLILQYGSIRTLYKEKFIYGIMIGLLLFIATVFPRGNHDDFTRAYNQEGITSEIVKKTFQGYVGNTFGIGLFKDTAASGVSFQGMAIALLSMITTLIILNKNKKLLFTWGIALAGFIGFGVFIFNGGVRQWGILFVFFILLLDLFESSMWNDKINIFTLTLLCLAPVIHNFKSCYYEIDLNYSNAIQAGKFINNKIPPNVAIVSLNKFETAAAGAYAGRKFFHLPSGETFTYFKWLEKIYIPTQQELILFTKYKKAKGLIVINNKPIDFNRFPLLKLWEKFDTINIKNENYYFYILDLNNR